MEGYQQQSGSGFGTQGRFTYADYSPLEDDRNLVGIIKDFVSLVSKVGRIDVNNKKLLALASDSDRLRQDIIAAIKNINTNTSSTMEKFHDDHADILSNDLMTKGSALLLETKRSLSELLSSTENGFDEQHAKYREKISLQITENNNTALSLVQTWLAADNANLPRPILLHLGVSVNASLDKKAGKGYKIVRRVASAADDAARAQTDAGALQFSYSIRIDSSELEFWNFRRSVTDLGIKDLLLPVGMRAPVSQKIKQTFRFGSRKDSEIMKEPEFMKVDGYFLNSVALEGDKALIVELVRDPSRVQDGELFRITYDVNTLPASTQASGKPGAATFPRVDYVSKQEAGIVTETDLLQIPELRASSDISKIHVLGAAVFSRMRMVQDPQLVRSRGRLEDLRIRGETSVVPSAIESGQYDPVFDFFRAVAHSFAPFVRKMQERTAVSGELILREELGGGQRKEYSIRINELQSLLGETENGKSVAFALGLLAQPSDTHKDKN